MPTNLSTSIEIDAPAEKVWTVISDLRRMGEWSPQCRKVIIRGGGPIALGTKMVNINRHGFKIWPTQSKVTVFEPNREIAFKIKENQSVWRFRLEPLPDGSTRVVETRDVSGGTTDISKKLIDKFMGGEPRFEADLMTGMKQTLMKVKSAAESA